MIHGVACSNGNKFVPVKQFMEKREAHYRALSLLLDGFRRGQGPTAKA